MVSYELYIDVCTSHVPIKLDNKLKVYKAVVLPTLLYACETWTVYHRHAKRLNLFHLKTGLGYKRPLRYTFAILSLTAEGLTSIL